MKDDDGDSSGDAASPADHIMKPADMTARCGRVFFAHNNR